MAEDNYTREKEEEEVDEEEVDETVSSINIQKQLPWHVMKVKASD